MKIIIGPHATQVAFFDDDGEPIAMAATALDVCVRPGQLTRVTLEVFADVNVSLPTEDVEIIEVPHPD